MSADRTTSALAGFRPATAVACSAQIGVAYILLVLKTLEHCINQPFIFKVF